MSRCQIVHYTELVNGSQLNLHVMSRCETHGMDPLPFHGTRDGPMLCPIGRIEEATEAGMKQIDAVVEKYLKQALTAEERAEAERRRRLQIEEELKETEKYL